MAMLVLFGLVDPKVVGDGVNLPGKPRIHFTYSPPAAQMALFQASVIAKYKDHSVGMYILRANGVEEMKTKGQLEAIVDQEGADFKALCADNVWWPGVIT